MNHSNTSPRSFSPEQLRAAFGQAGGPGLPDYLTDIVTQAARTRQRPAWTFPERWLSGDIAATRQGVPRAVVPVAALALLVTLLAGIVYVGSLTRQPERPLVVSLGIFESAAGRIVFAGGGMDRGHDAGLWAVDPIAPSVSTLMRLGPEGDLPLGWSSDGSKLLFMREDRTNQGLCCPKHLYIRHADGTETQLNRDAVWLSGATIAPDGSRVVFAAGDYRGFSVGLFVIDANGGEPVQIATDASVPTFSPDGTEVAFVNRRPPDVAQVWVANADGTDAHAILADEPALVEGLFDLEWSPAGDRIAMGNRSEGPQAIYTFAPDGSDFTRVITGGTNPYWSPDGSMIAYSIRDSVGEVRSLAIANADGSNVREFPFGASGPWHPGALPTADLHPEDGT